MKVFLKKKKNGRYGRKQYKNLPEDGKQKHFSKVERKYMQRTF